jgi:hypothetical protein
MLKLRAAFIQLDSGTKRKLEKWSFEFLINITVGEKMTFETNSFTQKKVVIFVKATSYRIENILQFFSLSMTNIIAKFTYYN